MKKVCVLVMFYLLVLNLGESSAFWKKQVKETPAQVNPSPAPVYDMNRKLEARAKVELSSRDWTVYLSSGEGIGGALDTDVLTFTEGKFASKILTARQYPDSNFTVTAKSNGVVVWEAVQTKENGDMAYWKGELRDESMRGVLSTQTQKGELQDFYFSNEPVPQEPVLQRKEEKRKRK